MASAKNVIELSAGYLNEIRFKNNDSNNAKLECDEISKVEVLIPYCDFFEKFLYRNQPCVIKNFITEAWKSKVEWISNGKPNFKYLQEKYGYVVVPVADCEAKYYNVQKKTDTPLSEFLTYWKDYMHKTNSAMPLLYMKDWHFTRDFPEDRVYRVPQYFASDWLNEYLTERQPGSDTSDDYRFIYMGPMGSWTPFHADVFSSFSWSVNVCGRKRWLLFSPGQENRYRNKFKQLAYDVTSDELLDENLYPHYRDLEISYEVIQEAGEAIFIPSGWHHQVWNLDDTISINHNWVNGCNIHKMWYSLHANLDAVKKEVEDCKDMEEWEEHCQIMLRATFGMNYTDFFSFLQFIGRRRLNFLIHQKPITLFGGWELGKNHALFDLLQLGNVLNILLVDKDITNLKYFKNLTNVREFLGEIENVLLEMV